MYRFLGTRMFDITIDGQFNGFARLQGLQMLEQQTVVHGVRVVIIGFNPLLHRQMRLVFVIAVFRNNTNVFISDLVAQFAIECAGDEAFARCGCAGDANDDALMRLVSHKCSDLVSE